MQINFKKYGNFQDKEVLPASTFSNAVATSSLITHSLVETIKSYYNGSDYTLSLSSFGDTNRVKTVLGEALTNYIYYNNTIFKTNGNLTPIVYNPSLSLTTSGVKKLILTYYEDIFNILASSKTINLFQINDGSINVSNANNNFNIYHKSYYNGDVAIGADENSRVTDYGGKIKYPALKYDSNGHVSGYGTGSYQLPYWSDCRKTLYTGSNAVPTTVSIDDDITNFSLLIINLEIGGNINSYPVFVPQLLATKSVCLDSFTSYNNIYNEAKIIVSWDYQHGNRSINVGMVLSDRSSQYVNLVSITGLVLGTEE